ncbi:MAG: glycyl-radical enzyme activating protein, partial [Oscillospiraceae bacterium]|nr:glycyl-radical enzyme activating protein [Oscillospiraceae bacterium]
MLYHNAAGEPCALVTNIQKYTIHDGPGIRTEIFFKGCNMHCPWCSNPETIDPRNQIAFYPAKCLTKDKCGYCVKVCPKGGAPIEFDGEGNLVAVHMQEDCLECMKCTDACPARAIKAWGELMTLERLMKLIAEDRSFYQKTGGGVTLNGGEVLLQWEFAAMLLRACKEASIGTCIETALNVPTEHMEAVIPYADLVITDIKCMDSARHKEITGRGNEQILKNIIRAGELGKKLVIRTPIVPDYNADEDNIRAIGRFLAENVRGNVVQYQLLPYRKMGTEKYASIGKPYPLEDYQAPERSQWEANLLHLAELLREEFGLPAVAGSSA